MITTPLQPHQKRALEKALKNNLVIAHGMGSGKTLTAIAIAEALGKPTTALVPAPTVENFKRELQKHRKGNGVPFDVLSLPTAVSRGIDIPEGNTVILDEAHAIRNESKRQQYVKKALEHAGRIIALTGTPAYNSKDDWVPLVNIVARKPVIPSMEPYVKGRKIKPGFLARLRGAKPGYTEDFVNRDKFSKDVSPYVDVFDAKLAEMPDREDNEVEVPMSAEQKKLYGMVENRLPYSLLYKLKNNIPPSKSESKDLNAFLSGVRQVSNTPQGFEKKELSLEELRRDSPKLAKAVDDVKEMLKRNPKARAFLYSNYKESGVFPLAKLLAAEGIKSAIFDGSLSSKVRAQLINDYNSGKLPVLLGTGAASEGLNLKRTSLVGILEPHFNNSRIEQAIARGIRFQSHSDLPPEERKVKVNRYYATFGDKPETWVDKLLGRKNKPSVDIYLKSRAEEKDKLMQDIKDALR